MALPRDNVNVSSGNQSNCDHVIRRTTICDMELANVHFPNHKSHMILSSALTEWHTVRTVLLWNFKVVL